MNAPLRDADIEAPSPVAELLFYQSVIGTLDPELLASEPVAGAAHDAYVERHAAYAVKAAREAKLRTSWTDNNGPYEEALQRFVRAALAPDSPFLRDARALAARLAPVSAVHGLAQAALKFTVPGVPDVYQGCELWDFSLVDPDNRRPVDYERRIAILEAFRARTDLDVLAGELLDTWADGRIKLFLTWRLLQLRRARGGVFDGASYRALAVERAAPDGVIAFARDDVIVAVPRLVRGRLANGSIRLAPDDGRILGAEPGAAYRSAIDGVEVTADADGGIPLAEAFARLPLAVLSRA
jgi:(1->4)-alpha-D-glucan 1-alpha-D-glucosylmutase